MKHSEQIAKILTSTSRLYHSDAKLNINCLNFLTLISHSPKKQCRLNIGLGVLSRSFYEISRPLSDIKRLCEAQLKI